MGLMNDFENDGTVQTGAPATPQAPMAGGAPEAPQAPQAPKTGDTPTPPKATKNGGIEALKSKGASLRQALSQEQKDAEGSKQGAIEFIVMLGDASKAVNRTEKGDSSIKSFRPCGARFKALENIQVPTVPLKAIAKDGMDIEPDASKNIQWTEVQAGQEFDLNLFEVGILMCQPQYGAEINGGGKEVILSPKVKGDRLVPLVTLKYKANSGSVKEGMLLVADKNPAGGYSVKAGFEKFAGLYNKPTATRRSSGASQNTDTLANIAAAWLNIATSANN